MGVKSDNWKEVARDNYQVYDSTKWKNKQGNLVRIFIYFEEYSFMEIYFLGLNSKIIVSALEFNYFDVYDKSKSSIENCFIIADYLCSLFCTKII